MSHRVLKEEMKAVARGKIKAPSDAAARSFNSVEALVRLLTPGNRYLLSVIRDRYIELSKDPRIELIVPFKNHGRSAGTSLVHPHAQMVGTPIMPADVRRRVWDAVRYYDENSHCLFC